MAANTCFPDMKMCLAFMDPVVNSFRYEVSLTALRLTLVWSLDSLISILSNRKNKKSINL